MTPSTMRFNALVAALFLPVTIAQVSISISNPQLSPTPAETITSEPTAAVPVTDALPVPTPRPTTMVVDTTTTSTGSGESVSVAPPLAAINTAAEADTIVGVARADEQFSTLLSAMDWVGMSTALTAPGPFTFFAPNNDAFATAPEAVGTWLQDPIAWEPQIRDLLSHHVVTNDELLSTELTQFPIGMEIYTAEGSSVTVTNTNPLMIDDSTISQADILATNGVIHAIDDSLLLPPSSTESLVDQLRDMPFFSTLVRYLDESNLLDNLQGPGPYTILAPTNEAFERVAPAVKAQWQAQPETLIETLLFHVAPGNWVEADFPAEVRRMSNDTDVVELAPILIGDILASNGVIHAVDRILAAPQTAAPTVAPLPTSIIGILQARGEFTMLLDALRETGRLEELVVNGPENPFTIFAPTDASFLAGLPEKFLNETWRTHLVNVLTYHIVRGNLFTQNLTVVGQQLPTLNFNNLNVTAVGDAPKINDAAITERNIVGDNGIIHVVDQLILPPSATEYVMDLYMLFPEFEAMIERVEFTNLTGILSEEGPMTVFSPVNGALANIPLRFPNILTPNNTEAWTDLLKYHIIPGNLIEFADLAIQAAREREAEALRQTGLLDFEDVLTANHTNLTLPIITFEVPTLQGSNLTISVDPNRVGESNVLFEDLLVKNGIIQVLDSVLIPPDFEQKWTPIPTGDVVSSASAAPTSETTQETAPIAAVERAFEDP